MKIEDLRYGDSYYCKHELKGGYGYCEYIIARVNRIGKTRVRIDVMRKNGTYRNVWVEPENLIRK